MPHFPVHPPRDRVLPNHRLIKGSTLRTILTRCGITREEFLTAYDAG